MALTAHRRPLLTALALVLAAAAGCAGDDDEARPDSIRIAYSAQPDSLDPALAYSIEGGSIGWSVYTPPLTYAHVDGPAGARLVPGLAKTLPKVSADGRTYSFRLRDGLRYSDGSPVRASDIEHAVKRALLLTSPGSNFFLGIRGANGFLRGKRLDGDIPGIEADDASGAVEIRLEEPDGTFAYALASAFAAPVPRSTPDEPRVKRPPTGAGPFRYARVDPGREIVLERNPHWRALPDVPAAGVERIAIRIIKNQHRQAEDVSRNRLDFMFDTVPPDLRQEMRRQHPDRYEEFVSNSTYYFWLNSERPPFDSRLVRRAVHTALNKQALVRVYGGTLEPTCNFLPPLMPGYRRFEPCPFGDPAGEGDVARARRMVRRAGAAGTDVRVYGNSLEPTRQATEAFAETLRTIGLDPKLEILAPSIYFQAIGTDDPSLQAGFSNWFQEYPHPASFFAAVRGDLITDEGNYNYSHTDLPRLTRAIVALRREPRLTPEVRRRWARVDRAVVRDAGVVPFGHRRHSTFMSDRMDFERCSPNHAVYLTDLARLCVR